MLRTLAAAALVAAAPLFAAAEGPMAPETPRTVTVTGRGEAMAVPDIARVTLGVTTEGNTAAQALDRNSKAMNAVFGALEEAGIAEKDIRTTNVSLSAIWTQPQDRNERPKIGGYQASNSITVTAREIAAVGPILDAATSAGATDIGGISFDVSDREARTDEARRAAAEDARRKAALYAEALGATLGPVLSIAEGGVARPFQPQPMMRMAMAEDAGTPPVAGGEEALSAFVTVVFGIE